MLYKSFFLLIVSFAHLSVWAQEVANSENIGDCSGAVELTINQKFTAQFTGKAGYNSDIDKYEVQLTYKPFNTFWFSLKSPVSGLLAVELNDLPEQTEVVIFESTTIDFCEQINAGSAQLVNTVLCLSPNTKTVFSQPMKAGNQYVMYINTQTEGVPTFSIGSSFSDKRLDQEVKELEVVKDLRLERSDDEFTLRIIDEETLLPIESSVVIKGTRNFNALYAANVIRFPDTEYLSFNAEINAPGYIFKDISFKRRDTKDSFLKVFLKPIKTDDQIEIDGIEFESQSDVLLESSKSKIRRLRDFLALNKSVSIEVIGHVHKEGRNTWSAKRLSKKRAKRVKLFLEDSGIDGDRISIKGMGNAEMKFPKAETDAQVQANRRVEIKIK